SIRAINNFGSLVVSEAEIQYLLTTTKLPKERMIQHKELYQALETIEQTLTQQRAASLAAGIDLRLPQLATIFGLSRVEETALIICLATVLDRKYERLYAYLQDDLTLKNPKVDLILNMLGKTTAERLKYRTLFHPQSILLKYQLLQIEDRTVQVNDRIIDYILGLNNIDSRLVNFTHSRLARKDKCRDESLVTHLQKYLQAARKKDSLTSRTLIFYLYGPYGCGRHSLVEKISEKLKTALLLVDLEKLIESSLPFQELILVLCREALLRSSLLCLENFDCLLTPHNRSQAKLKALFEAIPASLPSIFLLGSHSWKPQEFVTRDTFIELEIPAPDYKERKALWKSLANEYKFAEKIDFGALAGKFRFTPGQIKNALLTAADMVNWQTLNTGRIDNDSLHSACRAQSSIGLINLSNKIEPKYVWQDIILPPEQISQLREIYNQLKYRHIVYSEWGFDKKLSLGKGINVLFSGAPGTGKTMAAEVIAHELKIDLYKIDLAGVVSKYIGETEKNLSQIFQAAQLSNAILFFDEADALFGKRTEVKDSHDRYANIETSFLLQKMEEYEGVTILATNLRQNLDDAFLRRMQFIIEFPFPDEDCRKRIWETVFPKTTPLQEDINFQIIASRFKLAGGNIKNVALCAAFYAAEEASAIGMSHLLRAMRREYQKLGKSWSEYELSK
ncbi:MAG: ATP-binding protein, partial [Acidobacteriota bacterium]